MPANFAPEQRSGPRYLVHIPVRAEWDDDGSGEHFVVDGETENVGPSGALVHLETLPQVGSRVQLIVLDAQGTELRTVTEVIRLERNPVQPLAALLLIDATDEWRGLVWEPSAALESKPDEDYESEYEH